MGFYGNITNTNRTQFVFDKTYPNRRDMDAAAATDGIFVGRYVLVDYDSLIPEEEENPLEVMDSETYATNFNIDKEAYGYDSEGKLIGIGRGWDSTAWQKIYKDETYQYVMIAELNSVVPTFDVKVDAPTINPVKPHFDEDITNIYYPLHVQPSWGFRVGETEGYSDSKVSVSEKVWNEVIESNVLENKVYDGDIYFNKAGFNSVSGYKVEDAGEDKITVLPTGESGQKYNTYETKSQGASNPETAPDIQELRINLPSLGNTIAQMWDMIYEPIEKGGERNQHIEWDNIAGVRLVEADPNGNGFTYNPDKVNTLAGCINSVHDLMGMIITDGDGVSVEDALTNRIYYRENSYQMKEPITVIVEDDGTTDQEPVELEQFSDNIYYKSKESYYLENQDTYEVGNKYYQINEGDLVEQALSEYDFVSNKYYYQNESGDYILYKQDTPDDNYSYFEISKTSESSPVEVTNQWNKKELTFDPSGFSESVLRELFPNIRTPSVKSTTDNITKYLGGQGIFYVSTDADNNPVYKPYIVDYIKGAVAKDINAEELYYIKNYSIEYATTTDGQTIPTYDFQQTWPYLIEITKFPIVKFTADTFYYFNSDTDTYECLNDLKDLTTEDIRESSYKTYITLEGEQASFEFSEVANADLPFYIADKYYYKDGNNYIYAVEETKVKDRTYYKIVNEPVVIEGARYYQANKFYYLNEGTGLYKLDENETLTQGRVYYLDPPTEKYVYEDPNGIYQVGARWNSNVDEKELGIRLGFKSESYQWKKLEGFARSFNTIHGLILKINNILKLNDKTTRDMVTIQGCINSINDIINKIDELKPSNTLIVDNYGRISSAEVSGDNWIAVSVDPSALTVSVTHKDPVEETHEAKTAVTPKFGETFNITDYWFDDKGHKNEETTHTVTIPQGNLTDAAANGQDVITQLGFEPTTGALSTTRTNLSAIKVDENTTLDERLTSIDTSISEEAAAREAKDNDLQSQITSNGNAISQEVSDRAAADEDLQDQIIDNANEIRQEINARANAIDRLGNRINDLDSSLDNVAKVNAESDTQLQNQITKNTNDIDTLKSDLTNETSQRESADNNLQSQITALSQSISDEVSARTESDSTLAGDIADLVEQVTSLEENCLDKSDLNTSSIFYMSGEETKTSTLSEMLQNIDLIKTNFNKLLDVLSSSGTLDLSDLYL